MLEGRRCPMCGKMYPPMVEACNENTCRESKKPLLVVSTLLGQVLDQRYRLDQILGYGGMGVVYRATHIKTRQERAVKVLHPEMIEKEGMLRRFETEAVAASMIESDKAVKIVDFQVTSDNLAYLVMEMVEGLVLRKLIPEGGMEYERAVEIICQICEAVHAAHEKKIIHRDLKPDNVIVKRVGTQDRVKVLDFGIAKLREADQNDSSAPLTKVGTIMGTPQYMSPEQCRGTSSEALKPASDVYSIGIIAYEMFCGQVPFEGNPLELIDKHKNEPPTHLKHLNSSIPTGIATVVMRSLAKMPEDRWDSAEKLAQELRIALREARGGKTIPTDPVITEVMTGPLWPGQVTSTNQQATVTGPSENIPRETVPIDKVVQKTAPTPPPPVPQPNWVKRGLIVAGVVLLAGLGIYYWLSRSDGNQTGQTEQTQPKTISDQFGEMVLIPGGVFMMGSNSGEPNEIPMRSVNVKAFYLDKYEVTNEQYKKFVDATKHSAPKNWKDGAYATADARLPVTYVTWYDAVAYAKWANKRLPSESEWEFAARSGKTDYAYPWGTEWKDGYANVGRLRLLLVPVGGYANDHNEAGVFDLIGNVSEWVQDDYRTYRNEPIEGCEGCKVFRGGNAIEEIKDSRAAKRWGIFPDVPAQYADDLFPKVGFRCARDIK
ncbi:MAG TPA: bifunctional serine/threonine-protein kinase/formylglycine-generating enzyme family protein [Blastocatellia bacterium]|nr:bifunctional serine/threonine-protein kinase/formylglycine-generating enzyme family protein [Blastocatellia bacterium]HMV87723.1 bifunctional serine/threonine-protein kinase/formylglycine-generating enzyme family protein [Blastocatellia bacterium]HMX25475.1 bifunctional serine/threonine-protein kinase/formylglycine-generating enzyme family protein [Blastocatellia bacterium]HMZ20689.1 bifunctional serine/threonine-protein kinase/formylglycine-generating enzyme family protein [Blastocatellia ba